MKRLSFSFLIVIVLSFIMVHSCSSEEDDTIAPNVIQTAEEESNPVQYTLTVSASEGGTVSTEGGTFDEGTEVTITATPAEGYEFVGWEGSDSTEASLTITLGANTSLNALFDRSFFVSKSESFSPINQSTGYYNIQKYFSKNLDFGEVQVNGIKYAIYLPHGGVMDSGVGHDCSHYALEDYLSTKRVSIAL